MKADSNLVYNERLKALSSMFHNLGILCIGAGGIYPLMAANAGKDPSLSYLATLPIGLFLGACLAAMGQLMLKDLRA